MKKSSSKLIVLCDGGREFGFGHITRSISIAEGFEKYGYDIKFIVNGDDSINSLLRYESEIFNWHNDFQKLFSYIVDCDYLLIDSMVISNELLLRLEKFDFKVIFIDDEKRRNVLNRGIVIDWTVMSDKKEYFSKKKHNVSYILGSRYTPLRKEFDSVKTNIIRDKVKNILVTFGGSDVRNLTPSILRFLTQQYPQIKKTIIIGGGFTNVEEIKKYADINTTFLINADAKSMIKAMQNADIAIASGGQTLYELARIATPTVAILLVDNAIDDTLGWKEAGFVKYIGWYNDIKLFNNLDITIKELQDKSKREEMKKNALKHIKPKGTEFLVDTILGKI